MKTRRMLAMLLAAGSLVTAKAQTCTQTPADPLANDKAKSLLCYLATHTYVTGQTDLGDGDKVFGLTGRYPAIIAFDFYSYTDGNTSETQKVIDFAKNKKGIVAFQWHWKCPKGGGQFSGNCDFEGDLNNTGSKLYQDIDVVVSEMKKMGDAGVPVLFRPLHEANNNYMWWAKKGPDAYKKLWKLIWDRAQRAGTHNLLWMFNGMASGGGANTPMKNWYPGDATVDIISGDYTQGQGDYDIMRQMGNNKVVGIAETMNQLNPAKDPPFSFSVVWASRDWNGNSANDWKTAMANSKSISIDQLPAMVDAGNPKVIASVEDRRISNSSSTVSGLLDLATLFQDTSKLTFSASVSGSSAIGVKLSGTKLDLIVKTGDTGTATVTLTATNSRKLSSSVDFKAFLKDYHHGNLALHQPGVASSNDAYGSGASAAFDGDSKTRWSSEYTDDEWLTVDLDSVLAVDSAAIVWEEAFATSFELQTSTDSVTWNTVYTQTAGTGGTELISFPTTQARFVRMKGGKRVTKYGYSIWEMQVFGPDISSGISPRVGKLGGGVTLRKQAGSTTFAIQATGAFEFQIRNLQGNLVESRQGYGGSTVAMPSLRAGIYQAILKDGSGMRTGQILVTP